MQASINGIRINYDVSGHEQGTGDRAASLARHQPEPVGRADGGAAPQFRVCASMRAARRHRATKAPYDFETLAADVDRAAGSPQDRAAHFLGLSMGGMVGQYLGLLHPERFLSLTLSSTSSRFRPRARRCGSQRVKDTREKGIEFAGRRGVLLPARREKKT